MRKLVIFDINNVLCRRSSSLDDKYEYVCGAKHYYLMKPGILDFLIECNSKYDIALWTSGSKKEMSNVIEYLSVIDYKFIWYADMCYKSRKLSNKITGYTDYLIVDDDEYKTRTFDKRIVLNKMCVNNTKEFYINEYNSILKEINRLFEL